MRAHPIFELHVVADERCAIRRMAHIEKEGTACLVGSARRRFPRLDLDERRDGKQLVLIPGDGEATSGGPQM